MLIGLQIGLVEQVRRRLRPARKVHEPIGGAPATGPAPATA